MKIFYRISDNSYEKHKLPGATKLVCLDNFLDVFGNNDITLIADNCKPETIEKLAGLNVVETNLSNAGSFQYALKLAVELDDDTLVYFVEDDYLHQKIAPILLEEGIQHTDYITLYDHPDKYTSLYRNGETSKVIRTEHSHWRYTISTCMTFASKVRTLKEDCEVWQRWTNDKHPHDHHAFCDLKGAGRKLAVCIPGVACHTDLTLYQGNKGILMDEWAIDWMTDYLKSKIPGQSAITNEWLNTKTKFERLFFLDYFVRHENEKMEGRNN